MRCYQTLQQANVKQKFDDCFHVWIMFSLQVWHRQVPFFLGQAYYCSYIM